MKVLEGLRVLLVDVDGIAAERLAEGLRAAGATVGVTQPDAQDLQPLHTLGAEVVIINSVGLEGRKDETVRKLRADPVLRWASMLVVSWDEFWANRQADPDLKRLSHRIVPLTGPDRMLRSRAGREKRFDTRLELTGPSRLLRALGGAGSTLHLTIKNPMTTFDVDLSENLIVGASAVRKPDESKKIDGIAALSALLALSSGRVHVEQRDNPSAANIMLPLEEALATAAAELPAQKGLSSRVPPAPESQAVAPIYIPPAPATPLLGPESPTAELELVLDDDAPLSESADAVWPTEFVPPGGRAADDTGAHAVASGRRPPAPPPGKGVRKSATLMGMAVPSSLSDGLAEPITEDVSVPPTIDPIAPLSAAEGTAAHDTAPNPMSDPFATLQDDEPISEATRALADLAGPKDDLFGSNAFEDQTTNSALAAESANAPPPDEPVDPFDANFGARAVDSPVFALPDDSGPVLTTSDSQSRPAPVPMADEEDHIASVPSGTLVVRRKRGFGPVVVAGLLLLAGASAAAVLYFRGFRLEDFAGLGAGEAQVASREPSDPPSAPTDPGSGPAGSGSSPSAPAVVPPAPGPDADLGSDGPKMDPDATPAAEEGTAAPPEEPPTTVTPAPAPPVVPTPRAPVATGVVVAAQDTRPTPRILEEAEAIAAAEPARAASLYLAVIARDPQENHAMEGLATSYLALGNTQEAVRWARQAVDRRRRRWEYRILLGDALKAAGDLAGARAEWQEAMNIEPNNPQARRRLQ